MLLPIAWLMLLEDYGQAQGTGAGQAVAFIQNAMSTKAGGDCGSLNTTALTPVYTPYGAIGGGNITSYQHIDYITQEPITSGRGELLLSSLTSFHTSMPGILLPGGSDTTGTTLSQESVTLSQVSPNSIAVVSGFCGTGVKFSGTNGGSIGTNSTRFRRMKGAIWKRDDLLQRLQPSCSEKEIKKKSCSEGNYSLTEETIFFPNSPDMAARFAAALQQLVALSGGRPDAF
jgi:hypothetical protein